MLGMSIPPGDIGLHTKIEEDINGEAISVIFADGIWRFFSIFMAGKIF